VFGFVGLINLIARRLRSLWKPSAEEAASRAPRSGRGTKTRPPSAITSQPARFAQRCQRVCAMPGGKPALPVAFPAMRALRWGRYQRPELARRGRCPPRVLEKPNVTDAGAML